MSADDLKECAYCRATFETDYSGFSGREQPEVPRHQAGVTVLVCSRHYSAICVFVDKG